MKLKKDQRTILIFALSAIALIMVVGFAAFSTSLNINGTANISTNWCVGFDNTKTNTYQITKGKSTGTRPTATMGYDGTACSGTYVPIANLGAIFYQPGDKVEYTLTIANKGSIDAVIESITVDGDSVTSDQTITKGNIIWKVYMPESTSLSASTGTTTMVVSAEFQNKTDLVSYNAHETQTITVGINAVQNTGSNAMITTEPKFNGTIYRNNTTQVNIGGSIVTVSGVKWCDIETSSGDQYDCFNTEQECNTFLSDNNYTETDTCQQKTVTSGGVGEYTTDASTLNKTYYLKHDVVDDIITASYVCFVTDTEHCMQGGNSSYYSANKTLLQGQESWFNNHSGSCNFGDDLSSCDGSGVGSMTTTSDGFVYAGVSSNYNCFVRTDGSSDCSV